MTPSCSRYFHRASVQCTTLRSWSNENKRNTCAAICHMICIALICTALGSENWFTLRAKDSSCPKNLGAPQFFDFRQEPYFFVIGGSASNSMDVSASLSAEDYVQPKGLNDDSTKSVHLWFNHVSHSATPCVSSNVLGLMHTIIVLCVVTLITSFFAFLLDLVGPSVKWMQFIKQNSLPSIITAILTVSIVALCYFVSTELEFQLSLSNKTRRGAVDYSFGFYMVAATGAMAVIASGCTLIREHKPLDPRHQRLPEWDGMETFNSTLSLPNQPRPSLTPPPYSP